MTTSTYKHHEQKLINSNSMGKQNETRTKKGSQQKQESQGGSAEFQILLGQLHEESC